LQKIWEPWHWFCRFQAWQRRKTPKIKAESQGEVNLMSVVRWNPFREFQAMQEDMNRLFSRFEGGSNGVAGDRQPWLLPMDVIENGDALKLRAALPGVDPKDVNIQIEDRTLTVSAQRHFEDKIEKDNHVWIEQQYGTFSRTVTLPQTADTEKIEARYYNGVLELTVPKAELARPRKIELKFGAAEQPKMIEAGQGTSHSETK
jgi:HSP20 family protein